VGRNRIEHTCGQPRGTWRTCPCTLAVVAESKRRWEERNRENRRERTRDLYLQRTYGITLAEYDQMREAQDYRCELCSTHEDELLPHLSGRPRRDGAAPANTVKLVVDHCHTSGATRALLCNRCNTAVGYVENNADLLALAAEYVRQWKCCR
jgi:hypothetical protein